MKPSVSNRALVRSALFAGLSGCAVEDESSPTERWHETTLRYHGGSVGARADTRSEARELLLARLRAGRRA